MTRRIVQIELSPPTDGSAEGLYALCEDSSIHYGWWTTGVFEWRDTLPPIPDIPQDEPAVYRGPGCTDNPEFEDDEPAESDPIAEIEAMGGFLNIREAGIAWSVLTNEEQDIWLDEPVTSDRDVQLADLRAAAARLLARIRGAK